MGKLIIKVLIIIFAIILLILLISGCFNSKKQTADLLKALNEQTSFTYSKIQPVNFTWQDKEINGQAMQTIINPNFAHEIINFFKNNGFENIGEQNYQKDNLVCRIIKENLGTKIKIIINCGKLNN